jgi:ribonuclease P protein component
VQRLKSRADFQAVLAGRVVAKTSHFALHQLVENPKGCITGLQSTDDILLGAMAPKRWAKRAVTRNMIKRQAYTVFSQTELPFAAYVIRLRAEFSKALFASATSPALKLAVRKELNQLLCAVIAPGQSALQAARDATLNRPTL